MRKFLAVGILCVLIQVLVAFPSEDSAIKPAVEADDRTPVLLVNADDDENKPTTLDVIELESGSKLGDENNGTDKNRPRRALLLAKAALLKLGLLKAGVVGLGAAKVAGLGLYGAGYNNYYGGYGGGYGGYGGYSGYNGGYGYGGYGPYGGGGYGYGPKFFGVAGYGYF